MSIADVRNAVHEAAASAVEGDAPAEGTAEAETPASETPNSDASSEGQSATSTETPEATEAPADAEGTEGPTEYFGYQFPPDLTPEQRGEILSELKKRDDTIGKLLRGREEPAAPADETPPDPPQELTDEDILQALGLDPSNPFTEETAKAVLPVVRKQMEQEATISQLIEIQELQEIDRTWRSSLSGLEKEFGALPAEVDHEAVMTFAAENDIASPVDAYWRITGPGRRAVEGLTAERAERLRADKAAAATTRPGGGNAPDEAPLESKTAKGATREAASRILREMGLGD